MLNSLLMETRFVGPGRDVPYAKQLNTATAMSIYRGVSRQDII